MRKKTKETDRCVIECIEKKSKKLRRCLYFIRHLYRKSGYEAKMWGQASLARVEVFFQLLFFAQRNFL